MSRKALKQKNPSSNDTNINIVPAAAPSPESSVGKENGGILSQKKSKKVDPKGKQKQSSEECCFERELREMQEKLEKWKIEKERMEDMLKAREESLKQKDKEQEKWKMEIKKLQKIKEFKPTMAFPIGISLKGEDQEKKDKKVDSAKKKPSPPYVLWFKDQWNEVNNVNKEGCRKN